MTFGLDLKTLARALGGEISGGQVLAPGPGHGAADRSLSVKLDSNAPDGFLVNSFSTDDPIECKDYVRQKLGLPAFKPSGNGKDHAPQPRKVVTGKFVYQDESGTTLFAVGRIEYQNPDGSFVTSAEGKRKKTFSQWRPDPNNAGMWLAGVKDVRTVPYQLPQLLEAIGSGSTVLIVEGEAKVDLLWCWNVPATCSAMGAGKWKPEHSEFFRGAEVVILPDNDAAGRDHADDVGTSLQGIATSVRVLELPGLPPKGDIKDWARAGGTREKLDELLRQAKPWAPREEAKAEETKAEEQRQEDQPQASGSDEHSGSPLPFINMSNWDSEKPPERPWAVLNRIPLRQPTLFSGEGAIGKSLLELHLSAAHVLGRDWLGSLPEQGPAIYFGVEDEPGELHRRLAAVVEYYQVTFADLIKGGLHLLSFAGEDALLGVPDRQNRIVPTSLFDRLFEAAGDIKPKHIGIDTSADVFGGNENDRAQVRQFVGMLRRLCIQANTSLVLLSHPSLTGINSGSGLSGSTGWHNSVRARIYLTSPAAEEGEQPDTDLRELRFKKNNYGPVSENIVLRYRNGLFLPEASISGFDKIAREAKAEEAFIDLLKRFASEGRNVGDKPNSPNFAAAKFAKEAEAKNSRLRKSEFETAMQRQGRQNPG